MGETGDGPFRPRGTSTAYSSGWWLHHASLSVALWLGLPVFGGMYFLGGPASALRTVSFYGMASFGFVVFTTAWGALFGYYYEAKALRRANAEWVPTWWWWVGLHIPFWPIVAPLYVLQRHRRLGVPGLDLEAYSR